MTVSEENRFYIFFSFLENKGFIFTQNETMLVSQHLRSNILWSSGKEICFFFLYPDLIFFIHVCHSSGVLPAH